MPNLTNAQPDVIGYLYPDGRVFCPACQSRDALAHQGSPEGTKLILVSDDPKVTRRHRTLPWVELPVGTTCIECGKEVHGA